MKRLFWRVLAFILISGLPYVQPSTVPAGLRIVHDSNPAEKIPGEELGISLASNLIQRNVRNQLGQDLGQVKELVFEKDGRICYVLLSPRGGGQLIPVPFQRIRFDRHENGFIITNVDRIRLEGAPAIGEDQWNRLEDPAFQDQVFSYYGKRSLQDQKKAR
ncbi:MAG: PRC-barrel domain containing protein [Desulfobacteraceae bacterium]|nr:MAG: PRC-barrel domain containing protein [Desulfobacteraceae bacterium]